MNRFYEIHPFEMFCIMRLVFKAQINPVGDLLESYELSLGRNALRENNPMIISAFLKKWQFYVHMESKFQWPKASNLEIAKGLLVSLVEG